MEHFLKNPKYSKNKSENYKRIVDYSLAAFEDLAKVAELIPEDYARLIFTPANSDLRRLIEQLIGKGESRKSARHYQLARFLAIESLNVLDDKVPGHDGGTKLDNLVYRDELEKFREAKALIMASVDRGYSNDSDQQWKAWRKARLKIEDFPFPSAR
ncbi:MAG TPA: hypothetical protein VED24_04065 [Candidatus Acidoferrum sp.]|nr:hypothetical protein [Candidatus Acidoferrum sp.]